MRYFLDGDVGNLGNLLDLEGSVVYLEVLDGDRCCMGIEFTNLNDASRAMLAEYID